MSLRAMTATDLPAVLALNAPFSHVTSELDLPRLAQMLDWSDHARVLETEGTIKGFLLGFRESSDYDGLSFRWFVPRYPRFLYVDRLVVDAAMQRSGFGAMLYEDVFAAARTSGVPVVACEIDKFPPNPSSLSFHDRLGFAEVGEFILPSGKVESMRAKSVFQ